MKGGVHETAMRISGFIVVVSHDGLIVVAIFSNFTEVVEAWEVKEITGINIFMKLIKMSRSFSGVEKAGEGPV